MSAIISALQLIPPHTFYFPHLSFFQFYMQLSLSLSPSPSHLLFCFFLSLSVPWQRGASVNQAGPFSFRTALISADDVSKEVKGTTQRPPQLFPPIQRLQIYVSPLYFFLSSDPTPTLFFFSPTFSALSISIGPCT